MGDIIGDNFYLNKRTLSQQYFDSNNGDVSSGCVFKTATLYPNVKIQVPLIILMMMLKRVMVMLLKGNINSNELAK